MLKSPKGTWIERLDQIGRINARPQFSGKTNHRKCWRMAQVMAKECRAAMGRDAHFIPDWAGLGWIVSPFYNSTLRLVDRAMGPEWMARARRLCRALER